MKSVIPTCQVCGQGQMIAKKKFRMSGPVVFIGFVLLIPSALGILFGFLLLFSSGSTVTGSDTLLSDQISEELNAVGVPSEVVEKVMQGIPVSEAEASRLTEQQKIKVEAWESSRSAAAIGAAAGSAIAGGVGIFVMISSLVGGLLGWLLIMKKRVLQCNACGATVAAS